MACIHAHTSPFVFAASFARQRMDTTGSIHEYPDYENWEYHFEFQRMIRSSMEHFGNELLSSDELTSIIERILSGPNKDQFKEFMGDRYTEENFTRRQRHFQFFSCRTLRSCPISASIGKSTTHCLNRKRRQQTMITHRIRLVRARSGGSRSPKPVDELLRLNATKNCSRFSMTGTTPIATPSNGG